ncbi:polymer-forming cytoskeletal protein [Polynucleobacter sp. MWH-Svant-W18]|jgi:cytoskeletal protein CcmA (bactofilin family)|uniref:bactofilin family protein n=1 Tax=Polynucleobacter sp. MWH-Svant-W18 TaxID=1855909 RepID=UPI001BFE15D7|nr:polymer-forming cytoskeletal protein [Polynucleobacter sp. MWH-Svant-W18]MBT8520907.1 polymer-forming cytoskeletal protein [Polynucleobacter paneuropaeus]MBT8568817.1 polymer-forming cytoskeletal protein [Polynucleobacter paneuropaeus]MBT8606330.1 polymer-forming cytoskeletal protein [Polynucleobacter paneuropaeus]QWD77743.1 polymer-forming cytoskeletal protein [Polynucleobacter sp. MWH-Svant-W18]
MFDKRKKISLKPTSEHFETLVGKTSEIFGRMVIAHSLRIDGKVVGNIESDPDARVTVAIGEGAVVIGDITAYRVMVAGKVEGNIYAKERADFYETAVVRGDVTYGTIGIEHGSQIIGLIIQGAQINPAIDANAVIREAQKQR